MSLKINNLYKSAQLPAKIEAFSKAGGKLQVEAHKLACSVLLHLGTHKDVRVVETFLKSMPAMVRVNGLRAWFEKFGPIKFVTEGEGEGAVEVLTYVKDKPTLIGEAIEKPFWRFTATEGKPYQPLDLSVETNKFIDKLLKDTKHTGTDHTAKIALLKSLMHNAPKAVSPEGAPTPLQAPGQGDPLDMPVPLHA